MRNKYSQVVEAVLESLGKESFSCSKLESRLKMDRKSLSPVVSRMHKAHLIYIVDHDYEEDGQRRYPRAIYAVGDFPDAKRPTEIEAQKPRQLTLGRIPSVFHLAEAMHQGYRPFRE